MITYTSPCGNFYWVTTPAREAEFITQYLEANGINPAECERDEYTDPAVQISCNIRFW